MLPANAGSKPFERQVASLKSWLQMEQMGSYGLVYKTFSHYRLQKSRDL